MINKAKISSIRPWWLRLLLLFIIVIPAFTGWPIEAWAGNVMELFFQSTKKANASSYLKISILFLWMVYGCFIWFIVFWNVGKKRFWDYFTGAFLLGLTTVIVGALVRKAIPYISFGIPPEEISFRFFKILIIISITVPYFMFAVNSFSPKGVIEWTRGRSSSEGVFSRAGLHVALVLRMFQHVGEVVFRLFEIWSEEHPEFLLPRNRRDWNIKWYSFGNFFPWALEALISWVFACLMLTFAPLPIFVTELESIARSREAGGHNGSQ